MDRWGEIDRIAMAARPTTLAGAISCLEYARREHVQFGMCDGKLEDPGDLLILSLINGVIGALRTMGGRDASFA